jgi:precorrin-6B methylase 2
MPSSIISDPRGYYRELAKNDNIFAQMGKRGYSMQNFFVSINDIVQSLDITKTDILLDAAGGAGWYSIVLSFLAKQVYLFDYSDELIKLAQENIRPFNNIIAYVDDVRTFQATKKNLINVNLGGGGGGIDKMLVSGVIQHLPEIDMIKSMFINIFETLNKNGKALFANVLDAKKREAHFASYDRLDWSKEDIEKNKAAYEEQIWYEVDTFVELAKSVGFTSCMEQQIDKTIWNSTNMFNFVLTK